MSFIIWSNENIFQDLRLVRVLFDSNMDQDCLNTDN